MQVQEGGLPVRRVVRYHVKDHRTDGYKAIIPSQTTRLTCRRCDETLEPSCRGELEWLMGKVGGA
jgi:hypothetical protein